MIYYRILSVALLISAASLVCAQRGGTASPELSTSKGQESIPHGTQAFDIYMKKNKIGSYEARMTHDGGTTEYRANSESSVRLLGKHTVKFSLVCTFKDDMLINSEMISHKNGKLRDHTTIVWSGNSYTITKNGDKSQEAEPIRNCNIQLYFDEPQDNMITFSEKDAVYKKIRKTSENNYLLAEFGEDSGNKFAYGSDELKRVDIEFILGDFSMIRK